MDKCIRDNDSVWPRGSPMKKLIVSSMKCNVCVNKLVTYRNYSSAFIDGSRNLCTSAFKDHAKSDMHQRAILLAKKSDASDVTEYAPIAKALCTIDPVTEKRVRRKFEVAYMLCKENMLKWRQFASWRSCMKSDMGTRMVKHALCLWSIGTEALVATYTT